MTRCYKSFWRCVLFFLVVGRGLRGVPMFLEWHEEHQICLLRAGIDSLLLSSAMVECRDLPYVDFFRGVMMHPHQTLLTAPLTNLSASWSTAQMDQYIKALDTLSTAVFDIFKDSESERRRPIAVLALPLSGAASSSVVKRKTRSKLPSRRLHNSSKDYVRNRSFKDRRSIPVFPLVSPAVPAAAVHFQVPPKAWHLFSSEHPSLGNGNGPQVPPNQEVWQSIQQSTFVTLFDVDAAADPTAPCHGARGHERLEAQRRLVLAMAAGTLPLLQQAQDRCARSKAASLSPVLLPAALKDALGLVQAHQRATVARGSNTLLRYDELDRRLYAALAMALQQFARTTLTTRTVVGHLLATAWAADGPPGADDAPRRVALLSLGLGEDAVLTAVVHGLHDLYAATVTFSAASLQNTDAGVQLLVWPRCAISALLRDKNVTDSPDAYWGAKELRKRFEDAALPLSVLVQPQEASSAAEMVSWLQSSATGGLLVVSVPETSDSDAVLWSAVNNWTCTSIAGKHLVLLFSGWTLSEAEHVVAERLSDASGASAERCARVTVFLG